MIVTCENCDTSFQLDESRVPAQGIRVRCSRCKEAFFLPHPSSSAEDAIHGAAEEAAVGGGSSAAPGPTQDLPRGPSGAGGASSDDDEEHDWEFNVDPPDKSGDSGRSHARASIGDSSGLDLDTGDDEARSGLSLEGEDEESAAASSAADSAFGSVDDYSSLMEEDAANTAEPSIGGGDGGLSIEEPPSAPEGGHAGRYATAGTSDDLGDPESWDFFGESDTTGGSAAGSPSGAVLGRISLTSSAGLSDGALGDFGDWDDEAYAEPDEHVLPGPVQRSLAFVGHTVGWGIALSLACVVLISGFWSTAESFVRTPQDLSVAPFEAKHLTAHWVDTARGDTLLVVRGELVSASGPSATANALIEVSLLDARGESIDEPAQPAGTALTAEAVRELAPEALRVAIDGAAWRLAQQPIPSTRGVAFQAIFRDPPKEVARFAVSMGAGGAPTIGVLDPAEAVEVPVALDGVVETDFVAEDPADAQVDAPVDARVDGSTAPTGDAPTEAAVAEPSPAPGEAAADERYTELPEELTWGD